MASQAIPISEKVKNILFPSFMVFLVFFMIATTTTSGLVLYHIHSPELDPEWLPSISTPITFLGDMFYPSTDNIKKTLDIAYISTIGLTIGVFLKRCARSPGFLEVFLIILFLVIGVIQIVILFHLPTPEHAKTEILNGDEIVNSLSAILTRSSNVALAIFSSAMSIQIGEISSEKKNPL